MTHHLFDRIALVFLILLISLLQACATSAQKTSGMRNLMEKNRYDLALLEAEEQLSDDVNGVMENMNVGMLRRLTKDYKGSNEAFELAKRKIERLYATSVSEQAGATLINEELISYQGDRYEQVLLHLYMASNYLQMGETDAARVEILQSHVKMDEWGEPKDEVPFMRYFSGILFEMLGEDDSATVSYRKAVDAYNNTKEKHGIDVPLKLKHDLLRMLEKMSLRGEYNTYIKQFSMMNYKVPDNRSRGELIVMFENGMTPQRAQKVFRTWAPALSLNIKVAVPDYPNPPKAINRIRLKVNNKHYPLETVSNIDGLARAALAEDMPGITTRAIARAVLKKKSEKEAGDKNGILGQLAMMAINMSTEIADTRCWNTLPQEINLGRVYLPQGEYIIQLEVLAPTGHVVDTITRKVKIKAGAKSILTNRWTAPQAKKINTHPLDNNLSRQQSSASQL